MDNYTATEQAYKNGYEQGKKDAVKWISVDDRLPKQTGKYIVCTSKFSVYCAKFHQYTCERHPYGYFGTDSYTHITHWMPLPEPPMDGGNEDG